LVNTSSELVFDVVTIHVLQGRKT